MALSFFSAPPLSLSSPSSSRSSSLAFSVNSFSGLYKTSLGLRPKSFGGVHIHLSSTLKERNALIVKASSDVDGVGSNDGETPSESKEEVVPVEDLPLESKLQLKQEQQLRMKLAKKARLRRKRLVRKRHLRKKGRWPPSKMKKNKNV